MKDGGWHPRYAEVLAIATDGAYGVAIVDGNGDRADIDVGMWIFEQGCWKEHSSWGAFGEPILEPWQSGWRGLGDAGIESVCEIHGYAPGYRSANVTFDGVVHRVPVGGNGFWATITAVAVAEHQFGC